MDKKQEKELLQQLSEFLKKNKVKITQTMTFPQYNIFPDDLRLALAVLLKHDPQFGFKVEEDKKLTEPPKTSV